MMLMIVFVVYCALANQFPICLGLDNLISDVQRAVKNVVSSYSLKDQVSSVTVQDIVGDVRRQVEYRRENGYHDVTSSSLCRYMMPTSEDDSQVVVLCVQIYPSYECQGIESFERKERSLYFLVMCVASGKVPRLRTRTRIFFLLCWIILVEGFPLKKSGLCCLHLHIYVCHMFAWEISIRSIQCYLSTYQAHFRIKV